MQKITPLTREATHQSKTELLNRVVFLRPYNECPLYVSTTVDIIDLSVEQHQLSPSEI